MMSVLMDIRAGVNEVCKRITNITSSDMSGKTDAPVAKSSSVKSMVAAVDEDEDNPEVIAMGDVRTAFLQAYRFGADEKTKYVVLRLGKNVPWKVYKLLGPLYGQRDAPLRWYETFKDFMLEEGFTAGKNDVCIFYNAKTKMKVALHVDDVLTRGGRSETEAFFERMRSRFNMKVVEYIEPGTSRVFLAIEIGVEEADGATYVTMTQEQDVRAFAEAQGISMVRMGRSPMPDKHRIFKDKTLLTAKEHKEYRSIVGSLMWFATGTRFDVAHSVARLGQWLESPTKGAMDEARRVAAYVVMTAGHVIRAVIRGGPTSGKNVWERFTDSDHGGDKGVDLRSHTGVILMLNGMPVSWRSNKQPKTSVSSAMAEIYALSEGVRDALSVAYRFEEMGNWVDWPLEIMVDNMAGISFQGKTNPDSKLGGAFDFRRDWVVELQDEKKVKAVKVHTVYNVADLLTKCHRPVDFERLKGIVDGRAKELVVGNYRYDFMEKGVQIESYANFRGVQ